MTRILRLESPFLRGPDVKALQQAMHTNKYGDFFRFSVDGVFGPLTAHRVAATKWWLGYKPENIQPFAGDLLLDILQGKVPLTADQAARRGVRQSEIHKHIPGKTMGEKALTWALSTVGQHETPPGSNCCPATNEWGHGAMPWCAVEVSLAYLHAGSTAFDKSRQLWQWVPGMWQAAKDGGHGFTVIKAAELRAGDIIIHGPGAYHVTLFDHWADDSHHLQYDVGGNEGGLGYVYHDLHDASYADGFIRVMK
jgi:hypothetical protein